MAPPAPVPARAPGRTAGTALAVIGFFLISPTPLLLFGPLTALLLAARPVSGREWWWLAGSATVLGLWLGAPAGTVDQVANAAAVLLSGAWLVLAWKGSGPAARRVAWAVGFAGSALVFWCAVWGIGWAEISFSLVREWRQFAGLLLDQSGAGGPAAEFLQQVMAAAGPMARLFPARLILGGTLGTLLAAGWHHRISAHPVGPAPGSFGEFRFPDAVVWLLIAAIAVLVLPETLQHLANRPTVGPPPAIRLGALNLLVVCAALYGVRGMAVLARLLHPGNMAIVFAFVVLLLLPFTLIGLAGLGLADTWVDFRRRLERRSLEDE